jgi:hypothetical protein
MKDPLITTCGGCGLALVDYIYCEFCKKVRGDLSCTSCGWAKTGRRMTACPTCSRTINQRIVECCRVVAAKRSSVISACQVARVRSENNPSPVERKSEIIGRAPTAKVSDKRKDKKKDKRAISDLELLALRVDAKKPKTNGEIESMITEREDAVPPDGTDVG